MSDFEENTTQIEESLLLGNIYAARDLEGLQEEGITHIVSAPGDAFHPDNFTYLRCNIPDTKEAKIGDHFPTTSKFIEDAIDSGGKVLVH